MVSTTTSHSQVKVNMSQKTPDFQRQELDNLAGRLEILVHGLLSSTPSLLPTRFNATKVPKISLGKYIERIMQYCPTSKSAWIVSFIYLKRVLEKCGSDFIHAGSVHRLLITSVVLGSKYCDDHFKKNTFYARVGGFTIEELNALEVEMLSILNYRLYVKTSEFKSFEKYLYSSLFESRENEIPTTPSSNTENETPATTNADNNTPNTTTNNNIETKTAEKIEVDLNDKNTGCKAPFYRVELDGLLVAPEAKEPSFSPLRQLASLFAF